MWDVSGLLAVVRGGDGYSCVRMVGNLAVGCTGVGMAARAWWRVTLGWVLPMVVILMPWCGVEGYVLPGRVWMGLGVVPACHAWGLRWTPVAVEG